MGKAEQFPFPVWDPAEVSTLLIDIAQTYSTIASQRMQRGLDTDLLRDDLGLIGAFDQARLQLLFDPAHLARLQLEFWSDAGKLWQHTVLNWWGIKTGPVTAPAQDDLRFRDEAWDDNPRYQFIKQAYLLAARALYETFAGIGGLDRKTERKVEFFTRQFIDALAPTNFPATNPQVQREAVRSGGLSLLRGLRNLLHDIARGDGMLKISMSDLDAFELGRNIAVTPGKVVFQNEMMQLLQYQPTTATVYKRPLLIVPPWINKYYILDLREKNSFIKWAVDQGHTVFVISWVNPDESYADKSFDDYLTRGTLAALDAVGQATGEQAINTIGYCLGGTLLAATLAYMAAHGDERVQSATFFASLMDFRCPGELGIFIDEEQLQALDKRMARGYLDGSEMAATFNMLRANDLIWSFFVNNYLLGKEPLAFDLLYWNSDSTRMPAAMHRFYLRNMYLHNKMSEAGGISLNGTPIDLAKITIPAYFLSTYEDHIAPWQSTYIGTRLLQGENRFVLGGSGHIAGVINPPRADKPKYGYWKNPELTRNPDDWFERAEYHQGSWWPDWQDWISALDNADAERIPARRPGDAALSVLEDAPGSYAGRRID